MTLDIADVKNKLRRDGFYVSAPRADALWIADDVMAIPDTDITFSKHVCTLERADDQWVARFGVRPPLTCDVYGSLDDLYPRISRVFTYCRNDRVSLWAAFSQVIGEPTCYLADSDAFRCKKET